MEDIEKTMGTCEMDKTGGGWDHVLADFDFDALLSKYGPEGLCVISNKLREVALEDMYGAIEISLKEISDESLN